MKILRNLIFDKRRRNAKIQKYFLIWIVLMIFLLYFWKEIFFNTSTNINNLNELFCETFDIVYTWVNGSDPDFIIAIKSHNREYDANRFSDKNELKYSLRSVEKYAKWVRHIYIVTNGQIPYWLDLSNPRISVISHEQLSPDAENNLPTFSSSAIETFIHRIPNLSNKFLYLNDDIFLNDNLYPEDLDTKSEGVRIYNAWLVPDCADDCPWVYIGDGACDEHCNIDKCQFDGGDCDLIHDRDSETDFFPNIDNSFNAITKTTKNDKHLTTKPVEKKTALSILQKHPEIEIHNSINTIRKLKEINKIKPLFENITTLDNVRSGSKDVFSQSLLHTNMLLNKAYGFKSRYVLAHVGFLLDIDIIKDMQNKFSKEITETALNRFRSPQDVQFSFLYYNFLMSELLNFTIEEIFDQFDTDDSNTLSDREIRTMLIKIYQKTPLDWEPIKYFEEIIKNCSTLWQLDKKKSNNEKVEYSTLVYERYEDSDIPKVTKELVAACPQLRKTLFESFGSKSKYKFSQDLKRGAQSNFMMLTSNISEVIGSLDRLRKYHKKFNCINDDMDPKYVKENELIINLLEDFYLSFFPKRSQFELPENYRNRFSNLKDYEKWQHQRFIALIIGYTMSVFLLGILLRFVCLYKGKYLRSCFKM